MLIPNQLVEVRISYRNITHYKDLGYNVKNKDAIMVPPEHLPTGSKIKVDVICDGCGKLLHREYIDYLNSHTDNLDLCNKCNRIKANKTMINRYGVEHAVHCPELFAKQKKTLIEKYGVDCPFKSEEINAKKAATNMERYGGNSVMCSDEGKKKYRQTCIKKYGVPNYSQTSEYKIKFQNTCIEHFGVPHPSLCPDIVQKSLNTMAKNGTVKTSSQQIQVYEMIKNKHPDVILNYPFSSLSLDIFVEINNVKIDVEYDGWFFHQDKQKDIKRDKFLQSQGFKTLRIRSGHLLPTEQELFDAIDYLVNTEHHFKEIILSDWKKVDKYESLFDSAAI